MLLQVRGSRELLGANVAFVWLVTGMDSLVALEVRDLSEVSFTDLAFVRLVTSVGPLVLLHGGVLSESLLTAFEMAFVWLFTVVDSHVFNQRLPGFEGLAAFG